MTKKDTIRDAFQQDQNRRIIEIIAELVADQVADRLAERFPNLANVAVAPPTTTTDSLQEKADVAAEIEAATSTAVSPDDVRQMFIELGEVCGRDAQVDVLAEFNAKKLSDIEPEQHGLVVEVVGNMLMEARNG